MSAPRLPIASDAWMAQQQIRAELEAEAWRRMRESCATSTPPQPARALDPSLGGSLILKALVRFALGAGMGALAYIAALDSQLGAFEAWLAVGAAFLVALALSLLGPFRRIVYVLAETARWGIIVGLAFGALWLTLNQANV
jgi:hypothetical protein